MEFGGQLGWPEDNVILILDKIVQFIEKAPPNGVAEYVIFGIENHIFPSHVIL